MFCAFVPVFLHLRREPALTWLSNWPSEQFGKLLSMARSGHIAGFSSGFRGEFLQTDPMAKISTSIIAFNQGTRSRMLLKAYCGRTKSFWRIRTASTERRISRSVWARGLCRSRSRQSASCAIAPPMRVLMNGSLASIQTSDAPPRSVTKFWRFWRMGEIRRLLRSTPEFFHGPMDKGSGWYPNNRQPQFYRNSP
jgi:hypothetical protein